MQVLNLRGLLGNSLLFGLFFFCNGNIWGQFLQLGNDITGNQQRDYVGTSVSISNEGRIVAVGTFGRNSSVYGAIGIYEINGSRWIQKGNSIEGDFGFNQLGKAISLSANGGSIAIGGALTGGLFSNRGQVRVYDWDGTAWVQRGLSIDGEGINDKSGSAISLNSNGNILAIGSPDNDDNGLASGQVRIYEWTGGAWIQKGGDIEGASIGDSFGTAVDINATGDVVAIGAPYHKGLCGGTGQVQIYEWSGSAWVQRGSDIEGASCHSLSGSSVGLNDQGDILVIGAPRDSSVGPDAGHVRVYQWNNSIWEQRGKDIEAESAYSSFGQYVSINNNGTVLAIGAPNNDNNGINAGQVRLYEWDRISWMPRGNDIEGSRSGDGAGVVGLSGDSRRIVAGSPYYDRTNRVDVGRAVVLALPSIYGLAYLDLNRNCERDTLEIGLADRILVLNPGNIMVQTNTDGYWGIDSLPVGTYTISTDTSASNNYQPCAFSYTFTVANSDSLTQAPAIGYQPITKCPSPAISIHAPFLRPGFSNQKVYIQACNSNDGTAILDSCYIIVTLDSSLTVDATSLSYTNLGNNQYRVDLDSLYPGQCANFWFDCTLSQSAILGSSLCMEARLYPVDACVLDTIPNSVGIPCNTTYDNSHLDISSICTTNDTISFTITNTGRNMTCWSQVRLYVDTMQISIDSIQLTSGQSHVFNYAGDGRTWRMEVDQHPRHLGNSQPSTTIELCGNANNWTPNLVNVFPQDDADPVVDIYCGEVRGSYDPNGKTGYPLGVGATNDILPNQKMEYRIRFQNTGTDTAFTVVIRDTLSTDFDIFSVQSGVSSHPYTFRMYGPRVLEWTFNNIMLPDSNVNEPLSNGFVLFEVNQQPNLAEGTVLENSAGIYFDFNAPIITNTSQHTINRFLKSPNVSVAKVVDENSFDIQLYPNPTTGALQLQRTTTERIQIQVIDQLGRVLIEQETSQQNATINMSSLPKGLYFVHINDGQKSITKKVVKE